MRDDFCFYLNLCDCDQSQTGTIRLFGREFERTFQGVVDVPFTVDNDILHFRVPERRYDISLERAGEMSAVLLRARDHNVTVQAIYADPQLILNEACCHGNGCECYALSCSCVVSAQ